MPQISWCSCGACVVGPPAAAGISSIGLESHCSTIVSSSRVAINIEKVRGLQAAGRMTKVGQEAFTSRSEEKSRTYSYEQVKRAQLRPDQKVQFRKNKMAWKFFEAQAPSYRRMAAWYVISAKRPETRQARLAKIIEASANGLRI
jgi:uncharacterized protein YdeI (YjbR/CyaY-like superfamily)